MVEISKYIPEWTDEDTKIIEQYEKDKKEGKIKEYVLIERGDTEEQIKERFDKIIRGGQLRL
ncbi:MAG: hypothetical protein R2685_11050 [Candidatus Nitrosocosmicus sp.]|nr:hypothetical protein [Candidatus Nitrosocosmicus sp.]